jgi:hypothetical protein
MNAGMAAALLVYALDEQAKAFYLGHGFIESPIELMTLMRVWRRQRHDYCRVEAKKEAVKVDQATGSIVPAQLCQ